ncbi:uncharacterized protein BXZ73DRAFT_89111 [Epithele typhae]|uniref:uncharacterized protein n=1 Tax=Epithele typhae TaxID=378194 RepID=UPI0020074177|nr:uncharacterized protein BXZ73DRAFT_89111 [Epithele typhae]KAH9939027.1 hypothetical protein BXZ73DRAFT_89111 [Epithele typhae]
MIPTPTHPLTPPFASTTSIHDCSHLPTLLPSHLGISTVPTLPPDHQPASPRFLLSLLSAAVYLSIPSVASQALSAIVRTVGPHTAIRYLDFALGRGIGPAGDPHSFTEGVDVDLGPAVGLEEVAELLHDDDPSASYDSIEVPEDLRPDFGGTPRSPRPVKPEEVRPSRKCSGQTGVDSDSEIEDLSQPTQYYSQPRSQDKLRSSQSAGESNFPRPCYYYGAVSDKVGEAAACWLTRWGVDMLQLEARAIAPTETRAQAAPIWSPVVSRHVQGVGERPGSAPPELAGSRSPRKFTDRPHSSTPDVPVIWRRGGLTARWVRGILSSDALFVKGEKERYDMARSIVEMRRSSGVETDPEEDEDLEFEKMFNEGIYYANMNMDDLMYISRDSSPLTGKPFVSMSVLQAALWNQSTLAHRIVQRASGPTSPSQSPSTANKDLGVGLAVTDIEPGGAFGAMDTIYFPIPGDSSLRLGDSTGLDGSSMDQLFDMNAAKKGSALATEANFFGLAPARKSASALLAQSSPCSPSSPPSPSSSDTKWTAHPPFRFAVEFWDVDALREKSRLHSHTVWYAGSLYNVYVQVVRKKGVQLGIYLHRQSAADAIPPPSAPALPRTPAGGRGPSASVSAPRPPLSPSSTSRPPPPAPARPRCRAPQSTTTGLPATAAAAAVAPAQAYRDARGAVRAHFTIACASATGASVTRFTSAPDTFAVSQSWGWKSSSLRTEEYLEVDAEGTPVPVAMPAGREVSLRATVVLGVV